MCYVKNSNPSTATSRQTRGRRRVHVLEMGEPIIIGPLAGRPHVATIVWLPGFTWGARAMMHARLPRLRAALPSKALDCVRLVFLSPPIRSISCYNGASYHSWHDYFSDHGGAEGKPYIEERIDMSHLEWARCQV